MKIIKSFLLPLLFVILIFYSGCDKGISPTSGNEYITKAGFSGTITFVGQWPDSVARTHLVVFKNPLNSAGDFNAFNLSYVSLEIPYGTKEFHYSSLDSSYVQIKAGDYAYVAVAQSKTPALSLNRKDWYVVGVYYAGGDTSNPGTLVIPDNTLVRNINIVCDFNHPPKQPPGG